MTQVGRMHLLFIMSLMGAAIAGDAFGARAPAIDITPEQIRRFVAFYKENLISEMSIIFINNTVAGLLLIYFTPLALKLHGWLGALRPVGRLTGWDRFLLYGFPALFVIKQGIVMGLGLADFAAQIGEGMATTFFSIIFPHLAPEALALCLAAAMGLEVTRRALNRETPKAGFSINIAALSVVGLMALAAFLEVALTPQVFALVMLY